MPLEDFTTYTELDAGGDPGNLVVTQNKIDANGITKDEDSRVFADKGAAHFGATFEHKVKTVWQAVPGDGWPFAACWALSNVVEDAGYWNTNNSQAVLVEWSGDAVQKYTMLRDEEDGEQDFYTNSGYLTRYLTIQRTSETALECRIYSDAVRETLVDTLVVSLTNGRRYQYVFGFNSSDTNQAARVISIDVEDLDLQEAAPGLPIPVAMRSYRNRRVA